MPAALVPDAWERAWREVASAVQSCLRDVCRDSENCEYLVLCDNACGPMVVSVQPRCARRHGGFGGPCTRWVSCNTWWHYHTDPTGDAVYRSRSKMASFGPCHAYLAGIHRCPGRHPRECGGTDVCDGPFLFGEIMAQDVCQHAIRLYARLHRLGRAVVSHRPAEQQPLAPHPQEEKEDG